MTSLDRHTRRTPAWRMVVGGSAWAAILVCLAILYDFVARVFAAAIGGAFHVEVNGAEFVPIWWGFVSVAGVLLCAAVAAGIARRWIALSLAIVLAAGSAFLAAGIYGSVEQYVAPVERHIDPAPLHCQCHSGGDCTCPGG